MVARINTGKNIAGAILYNEMKVGKGEAELILAGNFIKDKDSLTFEQKVGYFKKFQEKNENVKTNTFHISLNFAVGERLDHKTLGEISQRYLEGIGFGSQPFLVYQHNDSAHPHIHLVTTNITREGEKIKDNNIARELSEPTRKKIEEDFKLVKAEGRQSQTMNVAPVDSIKAVEYGALETKNAISNTVRFLAKDYKYTSLSEYNLLLGQYNLTAIDVKGKLKSGDEFKGLMYSIIDGIGKRVGTPVKASKLYGNPGIDFLEKRFTQNEGAKSKIRPALKAKIDRVLSSHASINRKSFEEELAKDKVQVKFKVAADGNVHGIYFIDHKARAVFSGSQIGKQYSAKNILDKLATTTVSKEELKQFSKPLSNQYQDIKKSNPKYFFESSLIKDLDKVDLLSGLKKQFPQEGEDKLHRLVDHFKEYKRNGLEQQIIKEQGYFKMNSSTLIGYISSNRSLSVSDKVKFLSANDIHLRQVGDSIRVNHVKGEHIGYVLPKSLQDALINRNNNADNNILPEQAALKFSKKEMKVITALVFAGMKKVDLSPDLLYNINSRKVSSFLKPGESKLFETQINRLAIRDAGQHIKKDSDISKVVGSLLIRGIVVEPVNKTNGLGYRIGAYNTDRNNFIPVSAEFGKFLHNNGYDNSLYSSLQKQFIGSSDKNPWSLKYASVVNIQRSLDTGDLSYMQRALKNIEKINKPLHDKLTKVVNSVQPIGPINQLGSIDQNKIHLVGERLQKEILKQPDMNLKVQQPQANSLPRNQDNTILHNSGSRGLLSQLLDAGYYDTNQQMIRAETRKRKRKPKLL
jgi:hypothetical protein